MKRIITIVLLVALILAITGEKSKAGEIDNSGVILSIIRIGVVIQIHNWSTGSSFP